MIETFVSMLKIGSKLDENSVSAYFGRIFGDLPLLRWLNRSSGWFFETCLAYSALFLDSLSHEIFSKKKSYFFEIAHR